MRIEPAVSIVGHVAVPGDKSISHRAVLLGAIVEGETTVAGFGRSGDTEATLRAVRSLGAEVAEDEVDLVRVQGRGLHGLQEPGSPIDCGNAGTLLRLLAGILAGQEGRFELTGDESLLGRPVDRVAEPLERMGAKLETADGRPPLVIEGRRLHGVKYELPVASAQVKSCVLLAGLLAEGETTVVEPFPTRDHTELLLEQAGAPVRRGPGRVTIASAERLELERVDVPGDFSAAAPLIVRPSSRLPTSSPRRSRVSSTSFPSSPSRPPARAARVAFAAPASCARRKRTGSKLWQVRSVPSGAGHPQRRTAFAFGECRHGRREAAWARAAIIGSRSSVPLPGSSRARASRSGAPKRPL